MEKLQKALAKAREQRDISPESSAQTLILDKTLVDSGAPSSHAKPAEDEGWDSIPPFSPDLDGLAHKHILSMQADRRATPFDVLRTKIQLIMQKNGWRRLAVTSPTAACGKTTLACNLALGFTRQSDLRAVLMEFDLRVPNIANALGFAPEYDITEMLAGQIRFTDQAVGVRGNVAICAAKHPAPDPTATILSRRTHERLSEIEAAHAPNVMIFDLPPLLLGDDTRAFIKDVDCALLVAKAETTTVAQIDHCEREIAEQTNMLGVVLNQCHFANTDNGTYAADYGEG